jgi:hypothetical protein
VGLVPDRNGMRWRRRGSQAVQTEPWPRCASLGLTPPRPSNRRRYWTPGFNARGIERLNDYFRIERSNDYSLGDGSCHQCAVSPSC